MGKITKNLKHRRNDRENTRPPTYDDEGQTNGESFKTSLQQARRDRLDAERKVKNDAGACFWSNLQGKLFLGDDSNLMSSTTILKILFSIRGASVFWSMISDCDEVYNYWEPLHLLLFGSGFQTWEYSPLFGIRSYAYIYAHYLLALPFMPFLQTSSKVLLFHLLRFMIGLLSLLSDYCLYQSACKRLGNTVGSFFIIISIFSLGMFNASCAFLPSSFGMVMTAFAMSAYLQEQWLLSIFFIALGSLLGWPFCAVLGFPIVVEMLVIRYKKLAVKFFIYSLACGVGILVPMYLVDSFYYGKFVIAPLNIVLYNIFSPHGPNLYGVEDISYYIKNLLLNWNVVIPMFILSLPACLSVYIRNNWEENAEGKTYSVNPTFTIKYWYRMNPLILIFVSVALCMLIFCCQPHKEERFLFPVFPLIALLAAATLTSFCYFVPNYRLFNGLIILVFVTLSVSRGYALHRNFSASMETYKALHDHLVFSAGKIELRGKHNPVRLCVGKEWYRFPSSFFIPEKAYGLHGDERKVEMRFLESEFRGILPKPFESGPIPNITRLIPTEMNDQNKEERSRYVSIDTCDYVIDLDTGDYTSREPNWTKQPNFKILFEKEFLLSFKSHSIFRAFYVPYTESKLKYGWYRLAERIFSQS